jgi:hypothetical protein
MARVSFTRSFEDVRQAARSGDLSWKRCERRPAECCLTESAARADPDGKTADAGGTPECDA